METQKFKDKARALRPFDAKPVRKTARTVPPREVNAPMHPIPEDKPRWHGVQPVRFHMPLPKSVKGPMPGRDVDRAKGVEGA
jgi:hypothetical protein